MARHCTHSIEFKRCGGTIPQSVRASIRIPTSTIKTNAMMRFRALIARGRKSDAPKLPIDLTGRSAGGQERLVSGAMFIG